MFGTEDAKIALKKVVSVHGIDTAKTIEQLARTETAHFTSKQYQITGTGGMEVHGDAPYYGWDADFFTQFPEYKPRGIYDMRENKGMSGEGGNEQQQKPKQFVIMPSVEAWMMFLAHYGQVHANEGGLYRWYSTDASKQALYANELKKVIPRFVNEIK